MIPARSWIAAALAAAASAQPESGGDDLMALQQVLRQAVARVAPSTVAVETFGGVRRALTAGGSADGARPPERPQRGRPPEGEQPRRPQLVQQGFLATQGTSSGLVLSSDGWILTSRFALSYDPTSILVTLPDGRTFPAERKGEDQSRGIALLKIDAEDLAVPEMVDPSTARVGQWAAVLGRTFGREAPSVNLGIVSATARIFGRALQIDANCSPANYGGPVIDLDGRVLGVAVPLSPAGGDAGVEWHDSGIGFATTLFGLDDVLARMRQGELLRRGVLGVKTDAKHPGPGALLAEVAPDSTAAAVGMRAGDLVVQADGHDVRNHFHLQMLLGAHLAGDPVPLRVRRGDREVAMTAFLGSQ